MTADKNFNHVGDAAVFAHGGFAHSLFDRGIDAQIQRRDLGFSHAVHCNGKAG
jgi:hypothetical protein